MPMCNLSCHILVLPFAICHIFHILSGLSLGKRATGENICRKISDLRKEPFRKKQARRKFSTYPLGFCRIFTYICISGRSLAKR